MTAGRQLRGTDVKRLNRSWRRRTHGRVALIIESVTSPFNVGSISRSAAAFGVERVWLCGNSVDVTHGNAQKSALGTDRFMSWERKTKPADAAAAARQAGYHVIAVELTSEAAPLHDIGLPRDVCLALGSEDHGCSPALLAACDSAAYIPQVGRVGSLNVAVAAAVAVSEVRRREWAGAEQGFSQEL